jgi:hypothetical protein
MRLFPLLLLALFLIPRPILASDVVDPIDVSRSVLIYQNGRVLSIDLDGTEKEIGQFSSDLIILSSEYDATSNRIYALVEAAPFEIKTGKYLVSVVSLDLVSQKEEILYTGYNIQRLTVSPDGATLLIHQYKMDDRPTPTGSIYNEMGIRPIGAHMCILSIATHVCQFIDLSWVASQFSWLNKDGFIVTVNGSLYLCSVEILSCEVQSTLQNLWVNRAIPTDQPNQILIAASLQQPLTDGTSHFYYFDTNTHNQIEIEQLRKAPIYSDGLGGDGLPRLQDNIEYMDVSTDRKYLILGNWTPNFEIRDLSTENQVITFQGSRPQWLEASHTFVDLTVQDGRTEIYAFDVDTGIRSTLYTTDQPFHLIIP